MASSPLRCVCVLCYLTDGLQVESYNKAVVQIFSCGTSSPGESVSENVSLTLVFCQASVNRMHYPDFVLPCHGTVLS